MAKALANLRIQLTAQVGQFQTGMAKSEKQLQRFAKQARRTDNDMALLTSGIKRLSGPLARRLDAILSWRNCNRLMTRSVRC